MFKKNSRKLKIDEKEIRLSLFEQKLQSLSDSFYSTIVDQSFSNENKKKFIKNSSDLSNCNINELTFDQCSQNENLLEEDQFSFTFNSIDNSTMKNKSNKIENKRFIHSSTPNPIQTKTNESNSLEKKDFSRTKSDDQTLFIENPIQQENRSNIIGYYPVITYQPIPMSTPSMIFFKDPSIKQFSSN